VDELIKTVSEKAGINPEQARAAVNSVVEFVKAKAPVVGEHLHVLLSGDQSGGGALVDAADALRKKLGL
jgi:hypothetical protein